ncbi:MAG: pyridoxal 5'-phosphate synthase glutaminase subunit PdxT [Candidatus Marinimicrobia bacterium]|nr:pyridoxal 5'-phosphate synthase glutaminase subunit PdxT [Candidatus Neomarinimicrobiota bacterium]MBL7046426.1 pyridoxal 5'-phosphate synthase glutaminase subunit PdxT [Candidatus Neomarinimicrobiota bacterium]
MLTIGVLGLQGAYKKHSRLLNRLGVNSINVRYPNELDRCQALIIPGGESTTIMKLMDFIHIRDKIVKFSESRPIFGTCAGMILMAKKANDPKLETLSLIDMEVIRNAYGRQVDSFTHSIDVMVNGNKETISGVFIRAPRVLKVGKNVKVLASLNGDPVFVREGIHLATTFHPELSSSTVVHQMLINLIKGPVYQSGA